MFKQKSVLVKVIRGFISVGSAFKTLSISSRARRSRSRLKERALRSIRVNDYSQSMASLRTLPKSSVSTGA
jgi:hypothetical protein